MSEHTPGEWSASKTPSENWIITATDPKDPIPGASWPVALVHGGFGRGDLASANAALIAAAPALLKAAKDLIAALRQAPGLLETFDHSTLEDVHDLAEAVARAKGVGA